MTRHRVRVGALEPSMVLGAREAHHLQVLRVKAGDPVRVFDGQGAEALAVVAELESGRAVLHLGETVQGASETPYPLTLICTLLKGDKLTDVVRAATELGVARIQLLVTARADAREIGEQKLIRLRRIAEEASKQSRRAVVPDVLSPVALNDLKWDGVLLVAQPGSNGRLAEVLDWSQPLSLLTGPEGGLTDAEVATLVERGARAITLGPRILRAETAPIALLGAVAALGQ